VDAASETKAVKVATNCYRDILDSGEKMMRTLDMKPKLT